ncbi:putative manganese transporter [Actinophytocola gossypii]|uniref:Arsenic efflux protein n=1 Tax=Actinophytocola gossypii TaxID=2812003 RepID=A0ABT2J9B6_9PSEU|nr:putative manganese transporter [Actinophytocola gossypii]MCT2584453.1 arsenic efflux protein [Actinophytocola gossypii]
MQELLLLPLADAYLQVGVFVAVMSAGAAWLRWRYADRATDFVVRHRRVGPLFGALLGVSPGCAGALLLIPLFTRGTVSFGTMVAALTATMGDSSWVIMAAEPTTALWMHAVLLVTGTATGYVVDALGISPRLATASAEPRERPAPLPALATTGGPGAAMAARGPVLGSPAAAWLVLGGAATFLAVPVAFQLFDAGSLYLLVGVAGTVLAAVVLLGERWRPVTPRPGLAAALRESAVESARIVGWVAGVYLAWQVVELGTGFDGSQLPLTGMLGVLAAALVGLIPGCAIQITFTGLYLTGAVPAPVLLTNAVSQDGDALIPLLAGQRVTAAIATATTTVPAVLVGSLALLVMH